MVSLTFYGGVNEIGGNKILLEDQGTRIFLDFGKSFGVWGRYFEEYLRPTSSRGIETFWETGLLPDIEGIYRPDLLEFAGAPVHKETAIQAVLLSHAHFDHAAYISFLDNDITIYCTPTTQKVMETVQEVGQRELENEITNYKPRPLLRKDYKKPPIKRKIVGVEKKFKIGPLEVEPLPVDHSVPGACAFIIHCSEGAVVYSGDIRMHGIMGHLTQEFAERAAIAKPELFLCEGTRITATENHGEAYVKANSAKVINETKKIVFADFSWKDTSRFLTFYECAKAAGRKLLIPFRTARYIQVLKQVIPALPEINDASILLYQEKCGSGTYDAADYTEQWKKAMLDAPNTVRAGYVHAHQGEIIACLGYFDMLDLLDIKPDAGSSYIHSMSEAFNEEMAFDERRCNHWLELLGLPKHQIHASGHAPQPDIAHVISTINPKKLVPIHTEHWEEFRKLHPSVKMPEIGKAMEI